MPLMHIPDDREPFDDFYRKNFVYLTRWARRIGARADEAEDVVQEAMAQAYRKWHTLTSPLAWVKRAVITELTKVVQRAIEEAKVRQALGKEGRVEPPPTDQWELVREALRCLPEAQREAFAFTFDGLKPTDIAPIVNKNPRTVRANLREARRHLREKFGLTGRSRDRSRKGGESDA